VSGRVPAGFCGAGENDMGKIFYLMGKSASGKDTVYRRLLETMPELRRVIPFTTRPVREGETEGVEYHFVSPEELENLRRAGRVIESRTYQTVKGPWTYATVDDGTIDPDRFSYLMIGTLESYLAVKAYFPAGTAVPVYLWLDGGERLVRAVRREQMQKDPDYREVCRRYLADEEDFSEEKLRAAGIGGGFENEDLESCVRAVGAFIREREEASGR
jgi:guanylate kinase